MISDRQQKILNLLIKEYIDKAEPISSDLLQRKSNLKVSPATIRNDLQNLTEQGYIEQPHTSAGRVPTEKGYKFFIQITFSSREGKFPDFILKEAESAKQKIQIELDLVRELARSLEEISSALSLSQSTKEDSLFDILRIMGPSKMTYQRNIDVMRELLDEFENL